MFVDTSEDHKCTFTSSLREFLRLIRLLTWGMRLAPDLMNFAYVRSTEIHGSSQISADLKHLGPLPSVCFHLRANLPQKHSKESPRVYCPNIKFNLLACNKQYVGVLHDMCKPFINSVSCWQITHNSGIAGTVCPYAVLPTSPLVKGRECTAIQGLRSIRAAWKGPYLNDNALMWMNICEVPKLPNLQKSSSRVG